jgi:cyclopropane fatty-acyl-phospholipid synthase-like methyltransferase
MHIFEEQYQELGFKSQRTYPNESLVAFIKSKFFNIKLEDRKKIKVLELGCGSGANLWMIAEEGFDTYGIDSSPTGLEYCKKMLDKWTVSAILKLEDFTSLSFDNEYFDVIIDVVSTQHLSYLQHKKCYKEVYRCLKSKGNFFSYHLGENSISLKSNDEMIDHCTVKEVKNGFPLANNGQTCFISANEVRKELKVAGFAKVVIEKLIRSYSNQTQYIEYLSIVAEK